MRHPLVLLLLLTLVTGFRVQALEPKRAATPQIRQWIAQLDHDDFAAREQAAKSLAHCGPAAIAPLAEGVVSANPEVAWRCSETLERIAMEGDEATMDRVVLVLGQIAARGKPQLVQFAAQMRDRQRVFRHNRAAAAIRNLGGQVAGGDAESGVSDLGAAELEVVEDIVAAPVFELPDEPADLDLPAFAEPPLAEAKPAWVELLEALKIVEATPELKWTDIAEGTTDTLESEGAAEGAGKPGPPAISDRVAAAVLPGKVGGALRRALGLGHAHVVEGAMPDVPPAEEPAAPAGPEVARGFELLPLKKVVEADEKAKAAEAAPPVAIAEVEAVDFGIVGAPVFLGGGMFISDGSSGMPGYLTLGREWRGGDDGLKHLKDLSGISQLQIDHADLSDAALPHIAKLKSLTYISIRGGKFSREALRALHRERSKVSLMAMGDGMMGVNASFNPDGCFLDTVMAGTAAHDAGLQAGDKVTAIAGDPIADFSELTIAVSTRKPGDKLKIVYDRGGEQRETDLTLKARPAGQ